MASTDAQVESGAELAVPLDSLENSELPLQNQAPLFRRHLREEKRAPEELLPRPHLFRLPGATYQTLALAMLSLTLLTSGTWLYVAAWRPLRLAAWFSLGSALGLCLAMHGGASVDVAAAIALHIGVAFAMYPSCARFGLGALGALIACRGSGLALQANGCETAVFAAMALSGAVAAHRFKTTSLCLLSSLAGGYGLASVLHCLGRMAWLLLRNVNDPTEFIHPVHNLSRLWTVAGVEYTLFAVLWANLTFLGFVMQRSLFLGLWPEAAGDVCPDEADVMAPQLRRLSAEEQAADIYLPAKALSRDTKSESHAFPSRSRQLT